MTDFTFHRDVPFEVNFRAICKDRKYGEMWGTPWKDHFFFEYKNSSEGVFNAPPINDVYGSHPTTILKAQQGADGKTPEAAQLPH